jgi:TetR/AcrR family transcriptional regulator, transcriptional repressor for nem operon
MGGLFCAGELDLYRLVGINAAGDDMTRPAGTGTRNALMEATFDLVRRQGLAATSVDDICAAAGVSKGAFFHHFKSKDDLATETAKHWSAQARDVFAAAPYHAHTDPLQRVLGYIDLRREMMDGDIAGFACVAGTMVQEAWATSPGVQAACWESIAGHAQTLVADINEARQVYEIRSGWTAESLAMHMQAVIQGAFILAKASGQPAIAAASLSHLRRYVRQQFGLAD